MHTLPTGRLLDRIRARLSNTPPDQGGVILTDTQAKAFYGAFVAEVAETIQAGNKVNLSRLAIFSVHTRAARTGRNPRTGESVEIPLCHVMKIKPSKELRTAAAASLPAGAVLADDQGDHDDED